MRLAIAVILGLALVTPALALELGSRGLVKVPGVYPQNFPSSLHQGGDTVDNPMVIAVLPFVDAGTTFGYTDDYAGTCFNDAGAPDVVYRYTTTQDEYISISLCGSSYDTGLYVFDSDLDQLACNDDSCDLQSQLDYVAVASGEVYYIVVDGYASDSGPYLLDVYSVIVEQFECPFGGVVEGEPPLGPDYVDAYNGGCGSPGVPFTDIVGDTNGDRVICGVAGWYVVDDLNYRDTDWYTLTAGPLGTIEVTADAEFETYFFELGPQDCAMVEVVQLITAGPMSEASMTITGYAEGAEVWFWAGSTTFVAPGGGIQEYDYNLWFSGLEPVVATETATWSTIKTLYD